MALTIWREAVLGFLFWFSCISIAFHAQTSGNVDMVALVLNAALCWLWLLRDVFPLLSPDSNPLTLVVNCPAIPIHKLLLTFTFLTCILSPFSRDVLVTIVLLTFNFLGDSCQVQRLSSEAALLLLLLPTSCVTLWLVFFLSSWQWGGWVGINNP